MQQKSQAVLSVCTRCKPPEFQGADTERPGYRLAKDIHARFSSSAAARLGMDYRGVRCMSQCKRPCAIALSGDSRYTLVFGDLDPQKDAEAILDFAHQYILSPHGFVDRSDRPEPLRASILGRVPPLTFDGDHIDQNFTLFSFGNHNKETL